MAFKARGGSRDRDDQRRGRDDRGGGRGGRDDRDRGRDDRRGGSAVRGFRYQERSYEDMRQRSERTGRLFDSQVKKNIDLWRPKAGDNYVRILPPTWEGARHFGLTIWTHTYFGVNRSNYLCPAKMLDKRCPICEAAARAVKRGNEEEAAELKPKEQSAVWMLDRSADDPRPRVWVMSWTQDRDLAALMTDNRTKKVLPLDHLQNGYDITIKRTGKDLGTRYTMQIDRDSTPVADDADTADEIASFIEQNPLPDVLQYYDADYLERALEGGGEERDEDLDDDDGGRRDRRPDRDRDRDRGGRSARTLRDEEYDDDIPFDDNDRPARGRTRMRDDDDYDDADDDDDVPRRGRRA